MGRSVHVLLPVHNRCEITKKCITQLLAQTYRPINLVVIDDGSTDGTADMVRALLPSATILRGDGTLWWGGSLQRGMDFLRSGAAGLADIVLIMNDDAVLEPNFVENGVAALEREQRNILLAQLHDAVSGRYLESGVHVDWKT